MKKLNKEEFTVRSLNDISEEECQETLGMSRQEAEDQLIEKMVDKALEERPELVDIFDKGTLEEAKKLGTNICPLCNKEVTDVNNMIWGDETPFGYDENVYDSNGEVIWFQVFHENCWK